MTLHYYHNYPLTKDDCGPWDDSCELFKSVYSVHKSHKGFKEGEPEKKISIKIEFQNAFDSMFDLILHHLTSYQKGYTRSCLISHKSWMEIENWTL